MLIRKNAVAENHLLAFLGNVFESKGLVQILALELFPLGNASFPCGLFTNKT